MRQRDTFLQGEGDALYERNVDAFDLLKLPDDDPLLVEVLGLSDPSVDESASVLEIGCGDGARLAWLAEQRGCRCFGIDPSPRAIEAARSHGVVAEQGTAEQLPFGANQFDIVMFGFCLYLCDREDLFRIAYEADRVLKTPGWLLILDFYSPTPSKQPYRHHPGLFSHKMDYRALFEWHPGYMTYLHKVCQHESDRYTDDRGEWVAISVLRKNLEGSG